MAKSGLSGSADTIRILKEVEPELFKEMKKRLTSEINPIVKPIQSEINSQITQALRDKMPGMFHNGRSSWNGATLSTRVATRPKELIFINAAGSGGKVGFDYAELAGIRRRPARRQSRSYTVNGQPRRHAVNGQGDAFISKLSREFGKPGRFAWIRVLRRKPLIEEKTQAITDAFGVKLSRRLM